ncbi:diacylglycerol O-acyltransferase 1 isoform X2 [Anabrus simplex]|uniref:diacylglycerol O-acyltransferase 1 isoform X2 n=1 Tax=Anabrus simplex TaxID=316456 RepID=UPI0035A364C4
MTNEDRLGNGVHVRYRRTKSVTRAEEIQKEEAKIRRSQPDKPCHRPRDSLLSWSSGFDNMAGFMNWCFLLMTMGGVRLLLENLIKYGIRVDPHQWIIVLTGYQEGNGEYPSIILLCYAVVHVVVALVIEKGLAVEIIPHRLGMIAHILNIFEMVLIPMVVINVKSAGFSLIGATTVCMIYSVLFLKLWSYIQVNMWCRLARNHSSSNGHIRRQSLSFSNLSSHNDASNGEVEMKEKQLTQEIVQYPDNLNLNDIFYFILAPTLCYELNFPRTNRIRKRLLKLAIPNHLLWMIFFYLMFHSFLNLIGELLHFADRNFYCDWWNAENIDTFWRSWNMPVHRWALRHLYVPLVDMGYGRTASSIAVFFFSAFFHEYLVSIPLRTFKTWAFMAMMAQIPLSKFSRYIETHWGPRWGNMVVWSSLILGQPLCIMMYYHDYVITHYGAELLDSYGHV